MGYRNRWAGGALRAAVGLFIVGGAAGAYAQLNVRSLPPQILNFNIKHQAGQPIPFEPAGQIDTASFFPQIDTTVSQRDIKPRPGVKSGAMPVGRPNNIFAGGVGGSSRAVPDTRFPGIGFTGSIPPDCSSAVGPSHVVQTVNSSIAFYDKATGNMTFSQASNQFFAGTGATPSQFDPRVVFDQYNSRWIILFLGLNQGQAISQLLIATSDDANPNGTWNRFVVDSSVDDGIADSWFDYPGVGYTADAFVVSGNMFQFGGGFTAIQSFVIPTAPMYNNTGATAVPFTVVGQGFNIRPGITHTPGATMIYGISLETNASVRLWAYSALDTATPTLTSTTASVQQFSGSGDAPSGGTGIMDTIGDRTMDAMSRGTNFVATHTVILPGDNKSSVRWYEFNMGTWPTSGVPTLVQQGNITLGANQWAFMPAITMNSFGDISVIYTRSSASIFSDLVVSSRVVADPPGQMGAPTLIRSGLASNNAWRWGDYFTVTVDPSDDATFWGHGEVTRGDGWWATEITSWTVTTGGGGGGGGGGVDYDPTAVSAFMGTYNAGGLSDVLDSDNLFFDVDSVLLPGQGYFSAAEANFTIAEAAASVTELTVTVEANVDPGVTATGTVFLWNWTTNRFEYGKAFDVQKQGNDLQGVKLKTNPSKFVSGTGEVRVVFRAHDPFRRRGTNPSPFRLRTDLVKLNVKSSS